MIDFAAVTDAGRVRSENQDRWFADAELGLFVVADGLGGHAAGALAAQLVVDILPRLVRRTLSALTPGPSPEYGRGETEVLTAGPSPRAPCTHGRGRGEKSALTPGPSAEYGRGETSALTSGPSPRGRGKLGHDRLETYPTAGELCSAIAEQVKVLSDLVYNETHGQPGVNGTGTTLALALSIPPRPRSSMRATAGSICSGRDSCGKSLKITRWGNSSSGTMNYRNPRSNNTRPRVG